MHTNDITSPLFQKVNGLENAVASTEENSALVRVCLSRLRRTPNQ